MIVIDFLEPPSRLFNIDALILDIKDKIFLEEDLFLNFGKAVEQYFRQEEKFIELMKLLLKNKEYVIFKKITKEKLLEYIFSNKRDISGCTKKYIFLVTTVGYVKMLIKTGDSKYIDLFIKNISTKSSKDAEEAFKELLKIQKFNNLFTPEIEEKAKICLYDFLTATLLQKVIHTENLDDVMRKLFE